MGYERHSELSITLRGTYSTVLNSSVQLTIGVLQQLWLRFLKGASWLYLKQNPHPKRGTLIRTLHFFHLVRSSVAAASYIALSYHDDQFDLNL